MTVYTDYKEVKEKEMKRIVFGFLLAVPLLAFFIYASIVPILFSLWWVNVLVTFAWLGIASASVILLGTGFESREKTGKP